MPIPPEVREQIDEAITLLEKALGPVLDRTIIKFTRDTMRSLYIQGKIRGYERGKSPD